MLSFSAAVRQVAVAEKLRENGALVLAHDSRRESGFKTPACARRLAMPEFRIDQFPVETFSNADEARDSESDFDSVRCSGEA